MRRAGASETSVLLSLGSNIDPAANMVRAYDELCLELEVVAASRLFASVGVGDRPMPEFLNAAIEVRTDLDPFPLKFDLLREIEARLGRRRTADRNAPRTIDLDIALFGDLVIDEPDSGLVVPDPEIPTRAHVAIPLADLSPNRRHPTDGRTLRAIAEELGDRTTVRLAEDPEALRRRLLR